MEQRTKNNLFLGLIVGLPLITFILLVCLGHSRGDSHNGSTAPAILMILWPFLIVKLLFIVAAIAFVVQGFRVHWGWGLANLLVPFAALVFCFVHFREAKVPIAITLGGVLWLVFFMVIF